MGAIPAIVLSASAFDRTLAGPTGATYAEWQRRLTAGAPGVTHAVAAPISIRIDIPAHSGRASNVVAMLPGSDPILRDEWVVLTAHYDHLGTKPVPAGQDGIFNGADDNASGTAAMLEIAHRLGRGAPPRRSVLVLLTSGEERGLLGSAHYAMNPVVPIEHVVVDINVDMVGRSSGSVQGIAETSPELFHRAVELAARQHITVQPDQHPTWRVVYLSDDFQFTRFGVPAIEFFTGLHDDYHQPSDSADKIHFAELGRIVDAMADLAAFYAGGGARPAYQRPPWFLVPEWPKP